MHAADLKKTSMTLKEKRSDALTAVALQDHLLRSLNLSLSTRLPDKPNLEKRLAYKKPRGKAVVDSNRGSQKRRDAAVKDTQSREYVLDPAPPPPTLAQRLGLVEQPNSQLTETEWAVAKSKAQERHDFSQPCVICKEDIGKLCHVILSCSHVFHKNCLQAFERFSGKKTCPMCRKELYQTRVVHDGVDVYKRKSVIKIQACWRGFVVRCWYKKLRQTIPPVDPKLRRTYFEDKVITDRMVSCVDLDVNHLLYEISKSQENSRLVFEQFDARQRTIEDEQWVELYKKASARLDADCPICLTSTTLGDDVARSCVLTSCSHLFHVTCLTMFETLSESEAFHNSCPVCRSPYQKQFVQSINTTELGADLIE